MCGIVGVVNPWGTVDEAELVAMRETLVHRGPDAAGTWLSENGTLGLAQRRLSIIDLSPAANQPMHLGDLGLVLVFNGEIYNFMDLRRKLEGLGHAFVSRSDSEVLLHAYSEWGLGALDRMNGMFAFALYDGRRRRLLLARDRFGEKPLYYHRGPGGFVFASELQAITAYPAFSSEVAYGQLLPYLVFGYVPYPHTIFKDVYKLPPAHYLDLDVDTLESRIEPYWTLQIDGASGKGMDLPEAADRLEDLLIDSVTMRQVADVPVGAFLSGGVDSSVVVGILAKQKIDLHTFSIGVLHDEHDEVPAARRIAEHVGCEHHALYASPGEAAGLLLDLPAMYGEPFADSSAIPTFLVSRLAREHVKVALTGDGGDELFGGYTTYARLARLLPLLYVPPGLRGLAGWGAATLGTGAMRRHAALLQQQGLGDLFMYVNERTVAKKDDALRVLLNPDVVALEDGVFCRHFAGERSGTALDWAQFADIKTYLTDDNLTKVDRASMAVSLETRAPLLDHRIAEFAMGLPQSLKTGLGGQQRKRILREVLYRYLPRSLFTAPKRGFSVPLGQWLRGDLRCLVDEYLDPDRLRAEGLFDAGAVGGMVAEHMAGTRNRAAILWALISWEKWKEGVDI
jgi:asparagine synthase (glutamine-hydrolysing)